MFRVKGQEQSAPASIRMQDSGSGRRRVFSLRSSVVINRQRAIPGGHPTVYAAVSHSSILSEQ